jgi:3-oxoacyl-[acyl-carrier protein] reductase
MKLSGSVAFVTGGTGGLGLSIAKALAEEGADVCFTYHSDCAAAREASDAIGRTGKRAVSVQLDQADPSSVEAAIGSAISAFGRLDILVNNAATNSPVPFRDLEALTPEIWGRVTATNLTGPFLVARAAASYLRKSSYGRIVNVAAMIGFEPAGSSIAQAVSKAGVIHLTRCLAVAMAPEITVNCVAPGLMEGTRMASRIPTASVETMRARALLKRNTSIEDVTSQVVTYCRAESVTGQTAVIDGGIHYH